MNIKYTLAALALGCTATAAAQTLNQAKQWFLDGRFAEAKPVFEKLVKQAPSNANYNFWYGACCYETGEYTVSQKYLEKAAGRQVINAYLYLGRLYYRLYRFDEAVENIEEHISWLEKKKRDTAEAERELDRCRRAARMIRATEDVAVIDSFTVDKNDLLSALKLSRESGEIAMGESGPQFTNEMGDKRLVVRTDDEGKTGLYAQVKLIDRWSDPEALASLNDTADNLTYPFVDSDGVTLYYAAESEECLGGYDLFVTRYDSDDNAYLRPNNVGMPFNSTANDYLYAIDDFNGLGWFASDRFQPEGKVCVYVFVPNEQKVTYDYEATDPEQMIRLASLHDIRSTQTDADKVRRARQQLAQVMYGTKEQQKQADFELVVNDRSVYTQWADFRSEEARTKFRELLQLQKDLDGLCASLEQQRSRYAQGNRATKQQLAPGMLDQEKRVAELRRDVARLTVEVRNLENAR